MKFLGNAWLCSCLGGFLIFTSMGWTAPSGVDMDYGSFLSYTTSPPRASEKDPFQNVTTKGINIRLGTNAAICFDTELMRYSAGWTGGFLDMTKTHLTTAKGSLHVRIAGKIQYQTTLMAGWDSEGSFGESGARGRGSLPRDWAHYKGLYRHENQVVLHYTVGQSRVWDLPGFEIKDGEAFFSRTIHMEPANHSRRILVCQGNPQGRTSTSPTRDWMHVQHENGHDAIWVGLTLGPENVSPPVTIESIPSGDLVVSVPATRTAVLLKINLWRGPGRITGNDLAVKAGVGGLVSDPKSLCHGGKALWPEVLTTRGRPGIGLGPYVVDSLTVPFINPWKSWMRLLAFDFFSDGGAAVTTWNGDVWVVSGIDMNLHNVTWKRYAAGLFEGLGVKIVDDHVHVLERHQITRLHDLNGDGEADYYENFNNDAPIGPSYHAFTFGLDTDSQGDFYFTRCGHRVDPDLPYNGGMIRVSKDGRDIEQFAHGMRAPNGMSIGPGDVITSSDNQGNWTPTSRLDWVRRGHFYGFVPHAHQATPPDNYTPPICWIPYALDNSSGGQVWGTGNRWGPFEGHLFHTSYGKGTLFHVLLDRKGDSLQGAIMQWPLRFESGVMRGRFHPLDGQLYLAGLRGWQTSGGRDGAFQRVRYTGKPVYMPVGFSVESQGIKITFSQPLDKESALDLQNYALERWNYLWSEAYGSAEYSVQDPSRKGRDPVEPSRLELSEDGRTVYLMLPDFKPVMQMKVKFRIRSKDGQKIEAELYPTINTVPGK